MASNKNRIATRESLDLLEWDTLCEQLANFASTDKGRAHARKLDIPNKFEKSKIRLAQTLEIGDLDIALEGGINFTGIHDLDQILNRCNKGGVVTGEQLLKIADTLSSTRRLRKQIDEPKLRPIISRLFIDLATLPELEKMLRFGIEEGGRIADRASEKLTSLRRKSLGLSVKRKETLNHILRKNSNIFQDMIIGNRYQRPVLAVKTAFSSQLNGIVHDSSSSGNTVFMEPQSVVEIGNSIAKIHSEINKEEYYLLKEWSSEVAKNISHLKHLCEVTLELDLALTRARYGKCLDGVAPVLINEINSSFLLKN